MLTREYAFDIFKNWYKELLESEDRDKKIIRWLSLTIMIISISGSVFAFFRIHDTEPSQPALMPPISLDQDRAKAEEAVELYRGIISTRRDSQRIANDIIRIGRNPMVRKESPKEIPLISPEPSVVDLVDLPPIMVVRAVMLIGKDGAAVVDIDGVGQGIVVKKGMSFLGGKGRFVSINAKEVIFRWNGKNVSVPVDL